jgi:isopentenyl diphosphate isomerase/L-lactate dehydrogenase-like FMN-dependent dehydrogenase
VDGRLWALAANGSDGVTEMLNHLRNELKRSMKLCGVGTVSEIARDMSAQ